jgi:hypothetical protein
LSIIFLQNTPVRGLWIECSIASAQSEIIFQSSEISRLSVILFFASSMALAPVAALLRENPAGCAHASVTQGRVISQWLSFAICRQYQQKSPLNFAFYLWYYF